MAEGAAAVVPAAGGMSWWWRLWGGSAGAVVEGLLRFAERQFVLLHMIQVLLVSLGYRPPLAYITTWSDASDAGGADIQQPKLSSIMHYHIEAYRHEHYKKGLFHV